MEQYLEPTKDEIKMAFVALCIEDVAQRIHRPYDEIFERMDKVGMIDNYVYLHYETPHTESRENLITCLIYTLTQWENENGWRNHRNVPRR